MARASRTGPKRPALAKKASPPAAPAVASRAPAATLKTPLLPSSPVLKPALSARSKITAQPAKALHLQETAPALAGSGKLRVVSSPWADIYIDEQRVGNHPLDADRAYDLSAGEHVIELRNPSCQTYRERVRIERPNTDITIRQRLTLKPARLSLQNDQDALVFVNGEWRGRTPLKEPLELRWNTQSAEHEFMVSLSKEGYTTQSRKWRVKAGENVDWSITLAPEKARGGP